MKPIIADTSFLWSLASDIDMNHTKALQWLGQVASTQQPIIIPGEVITEYINVVGKKLGHEQAIISGNWLLSNDEYAIEDTTDEVRQQAFEIFKTQPQTVSYTDCLVMAFADSHHTKDIFGFDAVFAKNGYHTIDHKQAA